jgi:hypothetical protein
LRIERRQQPIAFWRPSIPGSSWFRLCGTVLGQKTAGRSPIDSDS